jgi:membrane protease YdiL (CAAX protease family)
MSVSSEHGPTISDMTAARAMITALTLAIGGGIVSFVGVIVFRAVGSALGVVDADAYAVADVGVQLGFAVVAAGYLFVADERSQYLKFRWPTIEDIAWIIALPGISAALSVGLATILPVLGIAVPTHTHSSTGTAELLLQRPMLWMVATPALYLFAAPIEEILYRGIVQGQLRAHFGTAGIVFVSGVAFGLMHTLTYLFASGPLVYTAISITIFGFVWAFVYERTENLVVTAVSHAMFWTVPFSTLLPVV